MAELKNLLTRISLRHDTYENWIKTGEAGKGANLVLNAGEVGICTIPAGVNDAGVQNPPHVMFKVGDGSKTFGELDWTSAKAADVYAWAKQASLPVTKVGNGNVVSSIEWDAETKGLKIGTASVATSEGLSDLTARVKTIEDTYATDKELEDAVSAINEAIALKADKTYVDTELCKKVNSSDFETFKTSNTTAIGTAKTEAIAAAKTETENQIKALDVDDTAVEGQYVSAVKEVDGKIEVTRAALPVDTLTEGSANGTVKFNGTDVAVHGLKSAAYVTVESLNTTAKGYADAAQTAAEDKVTALADGAVKANTEAIEAIKNGETGILAQAKAYADQAELDAIASAKGYTDGEIDKVEAIITKAVDGTTPVAKATDADKLGGVAAADYATKAYADQAEADALSAAKKYTDDLKDALLGEGIKDTFDTLVEIQTWIEGDGVNATELSGAIAAEAKIRADADEEIDGRLNSLEALVGAEGKVAHAELADKATEADHAAEADEADHAADADHADAAGKVDNALTVTLEDGTSVVYDGSVAKSFDLTGLATKGYADQVEADAISTAAGDATTKANKALADAKTYADGLIEALDYTDAAVAGKYVSAVQEVNGVIEVTRADLPTYTLTTGATNGTVKFNDAEVAVAGLGSAAYTASTAYATAAQGALADTALQKADITTGSANGTIAVEGEDVAVAGLKSAAYTEASAYATAAQGEKADSALQSVEVGTGLTVTAKSNNKQTIGIDETVIFVLNGGTSTTVI